MSLVWLWKMTRAVTFAGLEGVGAVASARKLIGSTNPLQAEPGTIRGDLAVQTGRSVLCALLHQLRSCFSLQFPIHSDYLLMVSKV